MDDDQVTHHDVGHEGIGGLPGLSDLRGELRAKSRREGSDESVSNDGEMFRFHLSTRKKDQIWLEKEGTGGGVTMARVWGVWFSLVASLSHLIIDYPSSRGGVKGGGGWGGGRYTQ